MADFSEIEALMEEVKAEEPKVEQEQEEQEEEEEEEEGAAADKKIITINDQENWHQRTMECFSEMWKEKSCLDFTIHIGEKQIGGHRLVLSLFSGFFHDYFHTEETKDRRYIQLDHLNFAAVESVLSCVYCGDMQVEPSSIKEVQKVLRLFRLTDTTPLQQVDAYIAENPGLSVKKIKKVAFSRKM